MGKKHFLGNKVKKSKPSQMKVISRLKLMNSRFGKNPITKGRQLRAMWRYIAFNILCRIKKNIVYTGIGGLKFIISKGDSGLVGNIYYGIYEANESMFCAHFIRETDTFLDIGANLGHYSIIVSGLTGARSIAIEPIPSTLKKLQKQIDVNHLNNKITAMNIGLSDTISKLYFSSDNQDMNHIVNTDYPNAIEVPVATMDSICENQSIALLKMDVEGYEKFVLKGGEKTLNNTSLKAMIVELNNSGVKYGVSDQEVYETLVSYGFLPYEYHIAERKITALSSYNTKQFNTIFIRDLAFVEDRINTAPKYKILHLEV